MKNTKEKKSDRKPKSPMPKQSQKRPGIEAEMSPHPKYLAKHCADTPMKHPGQPEEVAPAYVFFASETDSSYIAGEFLALLGGEARAA